MPDRSYDGARSGFTLIELLVVIAIIAILIGLLLPASDSGGRMTRHGFGFTMLLLGALAVTAVGCRQRPEFTFAPVEGTITKGGRPLADMQVVFLADPDSGTVGPRASGFTDEAGHYQLHGDCIRGGGGPPQDGAVVGKHRVCIVDSQAKPETPVEKRRVPPRYESFNETPLRAEVRPEAQTLDFNFP